MTLHLICPNLSTTIEWWVIIYPIIGVMSLTPIYLQNAINIYSVQRKHKKFATTNDKNRFFKKGRIKLVKKKFWRQPWPISLEWTIFSTNKNKGNQTPKVMNIFWDFVWILIVLEKVG